LEEFLIVKLFYFMEINRTLEKKLNIAAIAVSVVVLALVALMRTPNKIQIGIDVSFLPAVHAILNTLTALCLLYSFNSIKNGRVAQHRRANFMALTFSGIFLLCYVVYHFTTPETKFGGEGAIRVFYLILLLTHIASAALVFPFILLTFIRAYVGDFERHKKMARYVFPVWLYVAITGPICYLMLLPYYS
jgi:putative membrane protein